MAASFIAGGLPEMEANIPTFTLDWLRRSAFRFYGINRQKKALIFGADIPKQWHAELNLKYLGSVVNKVLPVFSIGRTALSMLENDDC